MGSESKPWRNAAGRFDFEEEFEWFDLTWVETEFGGGIGSQMAVEGIVMPSNDCIYGTILAYFGLLMSLVRVNMQYNDLVSTLPASIWPVERFEVDWPIDQCKVINRG